VALSELDATVAPLLTGNECFPLWSTDISVRMARADAAETAFTFFTPGCSGVGPAHNRRPAGGP
jgi:hypothetical protein